MSYTQFKTPFMELYEELSYLNEAVPKHPDIYFKDIIGYKDGQPVLKQVDTPAQKTLLDFVKKDQPTPLGLPEDKQDWVINSSRLSTNTRIEMICSNPACRYGGTFTPTIKKINERIWGVNKAWSKFASEQSVEDIALCFGCVDDRNMSKKKASTTGTAIWGAYKMAEIGGLDAEGKILKVDNSDKSLLKYLNIPGSLKLNPDLQAIDPKFWPALDEKRTFCFNCSECGLPHEVTGKRLRLYKKAANCNATDMTKCSVCISSRKATAEYGLSIAKHKELWERIPDWFFEDKSLGENAILTKRGYETLLELNLHTKTNKLFLSRLKLAFELDKNPQIKAAKHFTQESELRLPFICNNLDCITRNNGTMHEYISTPHLANKGIYYGCDSCASIGRSHSAAELFLRKSVELLFNVQHEKTKRIKPFQDIDILFTYDGKTFGIEYDGSRFHQDPKTVMADERKVTVFTEQQGITFIRIREDGCANFDKSKAPAKIIDINRWLLGLNQSAYESCLIEIGKIVTGDSSYEIPKTILPALIELFNKESKGKRDKRAIA